VAKEGGARGDLHEQIAEQNAQQHHGDQLRPEAPPELERQAERLCDVSKHVQAVNPSMSAGGHFDRSRIEGNVSGHVRSTSRAPASLVVR